MPLTLDQYADYLETRDLTWPAAPEVHPVKARPHVVPLPGLRAVTWNVYGPLLRIFGGDLLLVHPNKFVMEVALEKTVQEFKMWGSMSRKPGQPSEYLAQLYEKALDEQRLAPSPGEKHPEILAEKVWENILKKLFQKDYKFDAGFYGSLNEYSRKVAYFFHASLQGTAAQENAARAVDHIRGCGLIQGLIADGQCFTTVQLRRALAEQGETSPLETLFPPAFQALSFEHRGRKPSERLFRHVLAKLEEKGIAAEEVLHVGTRLIQDLAPAKKFGMKTALYAGDRDALQASTEQLRDAHLRPDLLLTDLKQLADVVGPL